ncbi:unnamed protein product [Victoria cruziana]
MQQQPRALTSLILLKMRMRSDPGRRLKWSVASPLLEQQLLSPIGVSRLTRADMVAMTFGDDVGAAQNPFQFVLSLTHD